MSGEEMENVPEQPQEQDTAPPKDWGEDISAKKDGGLFKKVLTPGSGSERPMAGSEVLVHYTGRLLNGEVFDSSVDRNERFKFKIGEGQVIKGWDEGVATMARGEKCILTCTPEYAYGENGSSPKIGPNETLQFEVELFGWKGEEITSDGGVIKDIIIKGENYSTPEEGATVEVHIRGMHGDRVFMEDDVTFDFGEGLEKGIVTGVEQAIGKMTHTESARILVKPQYAYGDEGCAEFNIPGGADLVYVVRLNRFTKAKEPWDYENLQERLGDASQLKERGGKYFNEGKYALAKKLYNRGAELITDTSIRKEEIKQEAKPMRIALHLNIAACWLKLEDADEALKECGEVLMDDAENIKAFFRSGQAHLILQNYEDAVEAFQKVLSIEPSNRAAQKQVVQTRNKIKLSREREKQRYANMFDKLAGKRGQEAAKPEEPATAAQEGAQEGAQDLEELPQQPAAGDPQTEEPATAAHTSMAAV